MSSPRVRRLRHENTGLRQMVSRLSELADASTEDDIDRSPCEQVQEEAIHLMSQMSALSWMSHQRFREVASAVLTESSGALEVLEAGGSLDVYREREW